MPRPPPRKNCSIPLGANSVDLKDRTGGAGRAVRLAANIRTIHSLERWPTVTLRMLLRRGSCQLVF
jgi:hypothetical protein